MDSNSHGMRDSNPVLFQDPGNGFTLPETNIFAPENGWLEYYFPIGEAYFHGLR